jgi:hypothetical protein
MCDVKTAKYIRRKGIKIGIKYLGKKTNQLVRSS